MKKQLLDFTPIVLFFITFLVTKNFIWATTVLVATTAIQLALSWILFKHIDKMQWIPFLILLPLAGLT
ncbi:MAG: septation protein IspZ, partial [Gammaproteobacteria bacterium]